MIVIYIAILFAIAFFVGFAAGKSYEKAKHLSETELP